ncbi:MAG TPA: hypothetical protein VFQ37_04800 [Mycobacterium sp.]|nr:hypothetical protein [Mycobacterium sp.]
MWTFHGLPAHILLNHSVVVLGPLTAILLILCALWPAARRRLIWLVLALAVITLVVTPLTIKAGEWLGDRIAGTPYETPAADAHMGLGETAIYFSVALAIAAALLAGLHVLLERDRAVQPVLPWLVAAVVIAASAAMLFQVYRIGESGARAVWGDLLTSSGNQ